MNPHEQFKMRTIGVSLLMIAINFMPRRSNLLRRTRFFALERILLPIVSVPARLLVRTWRYDPPDAAILREMKGEPRVVLLTFHGMFLQLLAFRRFAPRQLVVMLTPSLDGRLLAAALKHFGIDHVMATPGNRSVAGTLEFNRRLSEGCIGVIAADGPRGPVGIVQSRAFELSRASKATMYIAVTSARSGIRFGSWDRSFLPMPFARILMGLKKFVSPADSDIEAMQSEMVAESRKLNSQVLPNDFNKN